MTQRRTQRVRANLGPMRCWSEVLVHLLAQLLALSRGRPGRGRRRAGEGGAGLCARGGVGRLSTKAVYSARPRLDLALLSTKAVYSTSKSFLPAYLAAGGGVTRRCAPPCRPPSRPPAFLTTVAPDHELWKPSSSFLTSTESPALI